MTIREYWAAMEAATTTVEELDEVLELEAVMYRVFEDDPADFETWAAEEGIDLGAYDEEMDELVLTLWSWDMCGD